MKKHKLAPEEAARQLERAGDDELLSQLTDRHGFATVVAAKRYLRNRRKPRGRPPFKTSSWSDFEEIEREAYWYMQDGREENEAWKLATADRFTTTHPKEQQADRLLKPYQKKIYKLKKYAWVRSW